jgi:hypothetical protein
LRIDHDGKPENGEIMGLTGLEPVTLRLSSACSNQLSYRPANCGFPGADCGKKSGAFCKSEIGNLQSQIGSGGKGIRTPDFQLAKLALYQLSYAPAREVTSRNFQSHFVKREP